MLVGQRKTWLGRMCKKHVPDDSLASANVAETSGRGYLMMSSAGLGLNDFQMLLVVTGFWGAITVHILKTHSSCTMSQEQFRCYGYILLLLGAVASGIAKTYATSEPVLSEVISTLIIGFSSAVGGIYLSRGYFK